ncbi:2-amino-4-hydroxy-6-hydroxymethyldihydropteridine diphosphokinase [Chryseobacterium wangxinyae]|uniref:2-amino-4-hydroxy-6- hydroxymethyldihydropteridine diphosphokinase n=1 Tax=Chryseobacterium sp. CY350 TaxID=2997336 RepID=UPI00226FC6E9|nr:2-amino-4-hydroxy-6-hydroxymethyldihydropteridine diphosphokinase [Chryseobacterium sp. CY350]MCY0979016.1 2-amino-4-hydroxy-6-hydroxymethyldihydropteridine diphosphokinase [Chryseobacterium sp. CY350]WBZ97256.1 2-amino-4-hydroxy-6-hydroxymethyldihydropteridine diphosphokinase [Chryseobacterium sp. CY350]
MSQHKVVLLLGSNICDKKNNLDHALERLKEVGDILKNSEYLTSEPVEFVSSNNFCNIASLIFTHLSPIQLLNFIKKIEIEMGRLNDSKISGSYTDRIIDIDIVTYDALKFSSERLEIPHTKHLFERDFSRILLKDFI